MKVVKFVIAAAIATMASVSMACDNNKVQIQTMIPRGSQTAANYTSAKTPTSAVTTGSGQK